MDIHPGIVAVDPRQRAEKIPAAIDLLTIATRAFQLVACPKNGPLGSCVKSLGIEKRPLIVVSQQADAAIIDHEVEALARIGPIADNIAQAEDFADALTLNVG